MGKVQKGVQDLKNEALKQQLKNNVKRMLKQQQEMAVIWRDLIKIDDAILIARCNPDPVISLIAIQLAGKKRLPVEKEFIRPSGAARSVDPPGRPANHDPPGPQRRFRPGADGDAAADHGLGRSWSNWAAIQTEEPPEEKTDDAEDKDPVGKPNSAQKRIRISRFGFRIFFAVVSRKSDKRFRNPLIDRVALFAIIIMSPA